MRFLHVQLQLPGWVEAALPAPEHVFASEEERMGLVVELARENVRKGTGGPFAAAVFDRRRGTLLAPGVNLVEPANCSAAHAEVVACMVAQQMVENYDLGGEGPPGYELVTSTEPCTMCLGAVLWSGVRRLVCGARREDAEALGFDEGPRPQDWVEELARRGIAVRREVLREEAAEVLREYARAGGTIYGPRDGPVPRQ
ncbi:MAG: tRNA-specific adenosine deaminase [Desulfuromonas sp.]|uniref:nucleoside deaminase n=1 Tax=Desulfuromonas sp. TaxID=892 RepID=UPI000CB3B89C|nr:deaminase [Desulfuromonas sp.]PLX84943.1 MAG: tRNA-specific adenosine deaminase [Desulfuromonas sp.]